jgi:hypothetical protein
MFHRNVVVSGTVAVLCVFPTALRNAAKFCGVFFLNISDSSVGIATSWTARGSNPGGGEIFSTRPDRPWGLPSLLYNGYRVILGGKAAGAWR